MLVNTEVFCEEAAYFRKNDRYPDGDFGTIEWEDYWLEQERRCIHGYEVGGVPITGENYAYLNFYPIILKDKRENLAEYGIITGENQILEKKVGKETLGHPRFWDVDYEYFWMLEIARNGVKDFSPTYGRYTLEQIKNLPVSLPIKDDRWNWTGGHNFLYLKPRGVGASYKGGMRLDYKQRFFPDSKSFVCADNKEYLTKDGILNKYHYYRNWINKNCSGFARRYLKQDESTLTWRCGYEEDVNGTWVEAGYLSDVYGITIDGKPDKARGKRGDIIWEEFGNFRRVDEAWQDAQNSVEEDGVVFGMQLGYGTGNLEAKNFKSMEAMFYDPKSYNLLQCENMWDELLGGSACGWFIPSYRSLQFTDKHGNSDEVAGKAFFQGGRDILSKAKDYTLLPKFQAQKPFCPGEAMMSVTLNIFPTNELRLHKLFLEQTGKHLERLKNGTLDYNENGKLIFQENKNLHPYTQFPARIKDDRTGCITIFQKPYTQNGLIPKNLYRLSLDPYRHDDPTGRSNGAVYVIENPNPHTVYKGDIIVAMYVARPGTQDEFNANVYKLAEYYNCKIAFENDEPGDLVGFGKRYKKLEYLESQFELAYDANLKTKPGMKRTYGMHMGTGKDNLRKQQGDKYIQEWLMRPRSVDAMGRKLLNLHTIFDLGLIEELIKYDPDNDNGQYDRISSLRVSMYYEREFAYKNRKIETQKKVNQLAKADLFA